MNKIGKKISRHDSPGMLQKPSFPNKTLHPAILMSRLTPNFPTVRAFSSLAVLSSLVLFFVLFATPFQMDYQMVYCTTPFSVKFFGLGLPSKSEISIQVLLLVMCSVVDLTLSVLIFLQKSSQTVKSLFKFLNVWHQCLFLL